MKLTNDTTSKKLFGRLVPNLVLSVQPVSLKSAFNWQMFKETG